MGSKLILNTPKINDKNRKKKSRNIIWFKPTSSKAVSTNIAKIFLRLINRHFPKSHRLHKIFNRNTVKVSYSCMQNISKIYKGHNSKITSAPCNQLAICNCRKKGECPLDGKYRTMDAVYDCRVTSSEPQKIYFELEERKMEAKVL